MRESTIRLLQYFLGISIAIFILFHFQLFTSLVGPGYLKAQEWSEVFERMKNPIYDGIYAILLFSILTHGFIGIRNILFEYVSSGRKRALISWSLLVAYLILMVYGVLPIIVW